MEGAGASPQPGGTTGSARSKLRDWTEIGVAYALIMAVEWTPRPLQRVLWVAAVVGIAVIVWRSFGGWAAMGFRAANLGRSMWIAGAVLVVAGAASVVAARMHTLLLPDGPFAFLGTYIAYAIWSFVQQFLLQSFFLLRFLRVMSGERGAAMIAAVLFSTAHAPTPFLMTLTLVWGIAACMLFVRYRNIYPLMLAHAILGITVAMTVPGTVDHNMRVGLGYLRYSPHMHAQHMHRLMQP
jgi:hypothetical protein